MRPLVLVLVLPFFLLLPVAVADEAAADCEPGQWWVGYRTTRDATQHVDAALGSAGAGAIVCEGEQWGGQDRVAPSRDGSCAGAFSTDPMHASLCLGPDPNHAPGDDVTAPAGVRASADGAQLYTAVNAMWVGRVALYGGSCEGGEDGLEGASSCGATREARVGLYVRDDTPGNVIGSATCLRLTMCHIADSDCDHGAYSDGAKRGETSCGRDNTALGVQLLLA